MWNGCDFMSRIDISVRWDASLMLIDGVSPLGKEVVKSLTGRSGLSVPVGSAQTIIRDLEEAVERHGLVVG